MEELQNESTLQSHQNQTANETPRKILFNKYEMGRFLGQGNFAKVYYGRNLVTNESVAIKVIKKEKLKKETLAFFMLAT